MAVVLTVYSRSGCHLCEDMLAGLEALGTQLTFTLEVVDIDSDARLAARYGELVPVLAHGEKEICRYRLDPRAVTAHLGNLL